MNLRIHRLAVAEIDREVDYYESRQAGLGTELEDEIDAAFSLIVRFPRAAPQWRNRTDKRVAVLDRFPFRFPTRSRPRTSWFSRSRTQAVGEAQCRCCGNSKRRHSERRGRSVMKRRQETDLPKHIADAIRVAR